MLVLTRRLGEELVLGGRVRIRLEDVGPDHVRFAVRWPGGFRQFYAFLRTEVNLGAGVSLVVTEIREHATRIAVQAPDDVQIWRAEIQRKIDASKLSTS